MHTLLFMLYSEKREIYDSIYFASQFFFASQTKKFIPHQALPCSLSPGGLVLPYPNDNQLSTLISRLKCNYKFLKTSPNFAKNVANYGRHRTRIIPIFTSLQVWRWTPISERVRKPVPLGHHETHNSSDDYHLLIFGNSYPRISTNPADEGAPKEKIDSK